MGGKASKTDDFSDPIWEKEIPFKRSISKTYRFEGPEYKKNLFFSIIKSTHLNSSTDLVIKKIRKDINHFQKGDIKNEDVKYDFLREVAILQSLDQPYIVNCFEYFETDKFYYIIYPFFKGRTVLNYFLKKKNLSDKKVYDIIFDLLKIFYFLEQNKINLRNLDVENFIYDGKTLKLIGLSKAVKVKNEFQSIINSFGKLVYKSPETLYNNYGFKSYSWFVGIFYTYY